MFCRILVPSFQVKSIQISEPSFQCFYQIPNEFMNFKSNLANIFLIQLCICVWTIYMVFEDIICFGCAFPNFVRRELIKKNLRSNFLVMHLQSFVWIHTSYSGTLLWTLIKCFKFHLLSYLKCIIYTFMY